MIEFLGAATFRLCSQRGGLSAALIPETQVHARRFDARGTPKAIPFDPSLGLFFRATIGYKATAEVSVIRDAKALGTLVIACALTISACGGAARSTSSNAPTTSFEGLSEAEHDRLSAIRRQADQLGERHRASAIDIEHQMLAGVAPGDLDYQLTRGIT
ncbi:MAG: hypothetical protein HKN91_09490, partial [Acidimicrobiia bacterium]|nr:hypothetical protein [Acidimicrobiia bacterium]